jgi:hypothetical protein
MRICPIKTVKVPVQMIETLAVAFHARSALRPRPTPHLQACTPGLAAPLCPKLRPLHMRSRPEAAHKEHAYKSMQQSLCAPIIIWRIKHGHRTESEFTQNSSSR